MPSTTNRLAGWQVGWLTGRQITAHYRLNFYKFKLFAIFNEVIALLEHYKCI